jgi:hypothetical protein
MELTPAVWGRGGGSGGTNDASNVGDLLVVVEFKDEVDDVPVSFNMLTNGGGGGTKITVVRAAVCAKVLMFSGCHSYT